MSHSIDLNKYQVRTDLAVESHQIISEKRGDKIPGVFIENNTYEGINVNRLDITSDQGSSLLNKPKGKYITFEAATLKQHDSKVYENLTYVFADEFAKYLHELKIPAEAKVLIIGLGNWNVTPDALGPMVIENLLITRHLFELLPEKVDEGFRSVSAIAPGVLGITGIETSEVVYGIVEKSQPDFVIAIDALASRSIERVYSTIQVADSGIHPGSGIGNKRKPISKESLGVPVIAIGVPTVVDAVSITSDTIDLMLKHLEKQMEIRNPFEKSLNNEDNNGKFLGLVGTLSEEEKRQLIHEVLAPLGYNLVVTPKEVDTFIEDIANIIANGLNMALHKAINRENVFSYTH